MPPVGAFGERPPLAEVPETYRMRGRGAHQRARIDHVRKRPRILRWTRRDLGNGYMPSRLHKFLELPVCYRVAIDPESIHGDAMGRGFFRIVLVRSHAECAAWNEDHLCLIAIRKRQKRFR